MTTQKGREIVIKDHVILIDDEDFPMVSRMNWHIKKDKNTFYAYSNVKIGGKSTSISLHRFISGMVSSDIDHKNRNGLDNRKENLRYATRKQNSYNRVRKNSYGYRGVYKPKDSSNYSFQIQKDGKRVCKHGYITPEEAARAYDQESLKLHGEFGIRNFPEES